MNSNLFGGLEGLGISGLEGMSLFGNEEKAEEKKEAVKTPEEIEAEMLFDKTYECPVCGKSHKSRTLRTGKARMLGMDYDLRQKYEGIEPLKYDVVSCVHCGFTATTRYFVPVTPTARKLLTEKIGNNFKPQNEIKGLISFETAVARYKLALVNDMVKNAKASEKAYTCLRAGWLCKSWEESLLQSGSADASKLETAKGLHTEFIKNAYEGFVAAVAKESFPMCGMDEGTVNYLIAALAIETGHYDVSSKMISTILSSVASSSRMKDKARELKEVLHEAVNAAKGE